VTDDQLLPVDVPRHIVVREAPGRVAEVLHTTTAVEKWLHTHPEGYVVYDALEAGER